MEVPQSIVYLYSKYSSFCNAFNEKIKSTGIDYLIPVCIDNKDVRLKILSNSTLPIESVPCLLFIYPSGQIEKYEGQNCFVWVDDLIKRMTPIQPPPEAVAQPVIQPDIQPQMVEEIEEKVEEPVIKPKKSRKVVKPPPPSDDESEEEIVIPKRNKVVKGTKSSSRDNSVYKTEMIDEELGLESRPTNDSGSSGSQLINLDDILGSDRRSNEKLPIKNEKAGASLMAKAQELQKMRDTEDVKSPFNRAA